MTWHRFHASASIALLRTLLVCVNIIFMISGAILFSLGVILRNQMVDLRDITPEMHSSSPYILIAFGLMIFSIAILAFWCTIKGQITLLYIYSVVFLLVFIAEILLAATILMKKRTYEETFKTHVGKIMQQYPHGRISSQINRLQNALSCCGIDSYTDWFQTPYGSVLGQVPKSCCDKTLNHTCARTDLKKEFLPTDINTNGCYPTVISAIKNNYPSFGAIIIAIASFPLVGVILSCCLARQMNKHRYERVN